MPTSCTSSGTAENAYLFMESGKKGPKAVRRSVYERIQDAPGYPESFRTRTGPQGVSRNPIKARDLKAKLQKIERGEWKKVYKDGRDEHGDRVSIHYFESPSGRVFDVKVKPGWSN